MKRTFKQSMLIIATLLVAVAWSAPASYAYGQPILQAPVPDDATGGEDKKKEQDATNEDNGDASTAKDAEPEAPKPAPVQQPSRPAEYKVNSFNFLFEMLYHFNIIETTRLHITEDPAGDWINTEMPLYQGNMALVSY